MLRASVNNPDHPLVVAGITERNVAALKDGRPIKADLRSFGVDLPGSLVVIYGTTEAELEGTFRHHGLIGRDTAVRVDPKLDQENAAWARHEKVLIATVGLPRSGKSTWAKSQTYPVVCPDAIRLALHGRRYEALAEPFVWATAKVMVRALFGAGHKTVVLDATNTTRPQRDQWRSEDWGLFFKVVPTGAVVCHKRAEAEGDDEIRPVIDRMLAGFEPLGPDENLWP